MTEWVSLILDVLLITCVVIGIIQATRLIGQLRDLRAGRAEMERFVREFNGAVIRAEAGIKSLRTTARESGDDLEKLISKGIMVRDELNFIVESADGVAERLSVAASSVMHNDRTPATTAHEKTKTVQAPQATPPEVIEPPAMPPKPEVPPPSRAEKELLQALKKMS